MSHTPGPWDIEFFEVGIEGELPYITAQEGKTIVARIERPLADEDGLAEGSCDASLIMAAPDLLAALKQVTRFCIRPNDDGPHDDGYDLGMQMARAAIAKAEGK